MVSEWLDNVAWLALTISFICALICLADIYLGGHRQKMKVMEAVWPITMLYMGVIGLWAYWKMGRAKSSHFNRSTGDKNSMPKTKKGNNGNKSQSPKKPFWQSVFVSVCHCGGGCTLGDIIAEWGVFLVGFTIAGISLWPAYIADYIFALALGIVFQYFAIVPMRHYGPVKGLVEASKADFLSLTAFEVGMFGWMALTNLVFFQPPLHPDSPVFWFMMQIGMSIGFLTSYPMNWFLVSKGIKEAM
ncbi:MAG TPA: DUF4396 domain-containing protein [Chloroflexia bacterium]|nr:DUF4396 domain-containing protein [Chloroflexia bacterium]